MEWDSLPQWAQSALYALAVIVGWFVRQGYRLASKNISSYRDTVDERIASMEGKIKDIRSDIRALEDRDVQMLDEEEAARKKAIQEVRAEMQTYLADIKTDIRSIRQEMPAMLEKIIRASAGGAGGDGSSSPR